MAEKLTVGRIQQLSDKPARLDLSNVEVVKRTKPAEYTPEQAEAFRRALYAEGYAAGRAEVLALVLQRLGSHTIPRSGPYHSGYTFAYAVVEQVAKEYGVLVQETGKEQA